MLYLSKCISRKFSELLIIYLVNFSSVFKNMYSCSRIDRALGMREKTGTGLQDCLPGSVPVKQVGNLSEHARRKSIWRHILGVLRGFIWF
jgi:hypothetical protein